jgi:hypothetical protein
MMQSIQLAPEWLCALRKLDFRGGVFEFRCHLRASFRENWINFIFNEAIKRAQKLRPFEIVTMVRKAF